MQVSGVNPTTSISPTTDLAPSGSWGTQQTPASQPPFTEVMSQFLGEINGQQLQAEQHVTQLALGETESVNDVVLSVAKADMSFRLLMEIRNRLISSYQEIQRMQV